MAPLATSAAKPQTTGNTNNREQKAKARRISKGQIERRRRARINLYLNELKKFLTNEKNQIFTVSHLYA